MSAPVDKAPPKPTPQEISICKIGRLHGVVINQRQTGTDTADTFVKIIGSHGQIEETRWALYRDLIKFEPSYDSVAAVRPEVMERVRAYKAFMVRNAKELGLYERLKKKFEADLVP